MVRNGQMIEVDSLSELGIYGTYLRRGDSVIINRQAGHLVRTKVPFFTAKILKASVFTAALW